MKLRPALALATLAGAICTPATAALETMVPYDAFVGVDGDLDRNLWGPTYGPVEQKRFINELGQLELAMRVLGKGDTSVGSTAATYGVNFIDPAKVKEIAATIIMRGAGSEPCADNTDTGFSSARIAGSFFNNGGKTAGSQLNDVLAQVRFERSAGSTAADGTTNIVARVDKCTSADCLTTTQLFRQQLGTALAAGGAARVYLRWDQAAKTFNFKRGDGAYVTYTYTMTDTASPSVPFKGLQIRNKVENCAIPGALRHGWAAAYFDSVQVNASGDRPPTQP